MSEFRRATTSEFQMTFTGPVPLYEEGRKVAERHNTLWTFFVKRCVALQAGINSIQEAKRTEDPNIDVRIRVGEEDMPPNLLSKYAGEKGKVGVNVPGVIRDTITTNSQQKATTKSAYVNDALALGIELITMGEKHDVYGPDRFNMPISIGNEEFTIFPLI